MLYNVYFILHVLSIHAIFHGRKHSKISKHLALLLLFYKSVHTAGALVKKILFLFVAVFRRFTIERYVVLWAHRE